MTKYPVSTQELAYLLPHRAPMLWVDEVCSCHANGGEARVVLKEDALYMTDGHLRPSSVIEFIAQTFGFTAALYHLQSNASAVAEKPPLMRAFLVGIRDAALTGIAQNPELCAGASLLIRAECLKEIGPLRIINGFVTLELHQKLLAHVNLKLFSE